MLKLEGQCDQCGEDIEVAYWNGVKGLAFCSPICGYLNHDYPKVVLV